MYNHNIHKMHKKSGKARQGKTKAGFDASFWVFTFVAILLIGIGIYLHTHNKTAIGLTDPGKSGQGGGMVLPIHSFAVIAIGIFFATFPLTDLIRYFKEQRRRTP